MSRTLKMVICSLLLSSSILLATRRSHTAGDGFGFAPGQSVFVVAVRTTSRVDRILGEEFARNVIYMRCGSVVRNADPIDDRPAPAQPATLEKSDTGGATVVSTDRRLGQKLEAEFKRRKQFKLAASPDSADLVFFVFSSYPVSRSVIEVGSGPIQGAGELVWQAYEDAPYSTETITAFAFALPSSQFRRARKDAASLRDSALWQGYVRGSMGRCGGAIQGSAAAQLVRDFHSKSLGKVRARQSDPPPGLPQPASESRSQAPGTPPRVPSTDSSRPPLQSETTLKVETALVAVPVSVLDQQGRAVVDLSRGDFQVFEDGVEQAVDYFSSVETPINVALMLDVSHSMQLQYGGSRAAAAAFAQNLRPQDRLMVVAFNGDVYLESGFSSDRRRIRSAVDDTGARGGTRLYDAIDVVLGEGLKQVDGRKAIVLFSDGVDTESWITNATRTLELAEESGALIYTIRYDTAWDTVRWMNRPRTHAAMAGPQAYRVAERYLQDLAERTGAQAYKAADLESLKLVFSNICAELRQRYELAYYPSNRTPDGTFRRIQVRVSRPDAVVRARPGYRVAKRPIP